MSTSRGPCQNQKQVQLPSRVKLVTWNVDGASSSDSKLAYESLSSALSLIKLWVDGKPAIICLQEVHRDSLPALGNDPWVRSEFSILHQPGQRYDNLVLVSLCLSISHAFVIDFPKSAIGRRALFVDIPLSAGSGKRFLRIANTHLESLNQSLARRAQLALVARYLSLPEVEGLVCGDMNANSPADEEYPPELGLEDVWTVVRPGEEGFTWGHAQWEGETWPLGRFDKVFRARGVRVVEGIELREGRGEGSWVSDHHALVVNLRLG
ncbi:DNase I-like protein [Dacryopinax primogenitus]|uniref:DNase I-like protein n=1 Tax=Dacryopinax primogenitus (strain DJM 731) TaxID=1858805 RepID=M5FYS8_DACPD|nr:DNase I-like protein [Dacryopinax primogenitus]EJU03181.1 DNase I-like protein [Dacryopinax primogenitus]